MQFTKNFFYQNVRERRYGCRSNNIIYNLQFRFRQQYSTSHALINITENVREALGGRNIGCGVFVDLQKAFDTVDY